MPDLQDLRGPACIIHGSITTGFGVKGPFDSVDAAIRWLEKTNAHLVLGACSIQLMERPE